MINEERQYIIKVLMKIPLHAFNGSLGDLTKLQSCLFPNEPWSKEQDEFLEKLYGAHVQVIGECFTCFSKTNPMRLIKMSEASVRIICDTCRENLHSAQSN